jgi:hypothetical protein
VSSELQRLLLVVAAFGFVLSGIDAFASPEAPFPTFTHIFGSGIACGAVGFVFGKYGELATSNDRYETPLSWLGAGFLAAFGGLFAFLVGTLPVVLVVGLLRG